MDSSIQNRYISVRKPSSERSFDNELDGLIDPAEKMDQMTEILTKEEK